MKGVFSAALLLALAVQAGTSSGQAAARLARAERAAKALEYDRALALAQESLEQGDADPALLKRIFLFQAEMAVAVDLEDTAVAAYARALELDPGLELRPDASPRFVKPFRLARARVGSTRLVAVPTSAFVEPGRIHTELRLRGDGLGMVVGARVQPLEGEAAALSRTDGFEGHWACASVPCPHVISLLDARGNELLRIGSAEAPLLVLAPPRPPALVDTRPVHARGWPYAVLGGLLAGTGTVFAIRTAQTDADFRNARDNPGTHTLAQVSRLDGQRQQLYTVSAITVGLALGGGAVAAILWQPRKP